MKQKTNKQTGTTTTGSFRPPWVLITGASSGIGSGLVANFARRNCRLLLIGRDESRLKQNLKLCPEGSQILTLDLSQWQNKDHWNESIKNIIKKDALETLIHNAGVFVRKSFLLTKDDEFESLMTVNFKAPWSLTQSLQPELARSPNANVIIIASTLGFRPIPDTSAYSASKAAMINWTQSLAKEWAPHIRVNAICPGLVDTPIHSFFKESKTSPSRKLAHAAQPLARMGTPDDIAKAALYLCESSWSTGTILTIDGGISL